MKFKDPETGKIFPGSRTALEERMLKYCETCKNCECCVFFYHCDEMIRYHPVSTAIILGFEVLPDSPHYSVQVLSNTSANPAHV